jgi:transcription antitermination factor NusG
LPRVSIAQAQNTATPGATSPPDTIGQSVWVVLRTQPRQEPIAFKSILAQGVEPYLPLLPPRRPTEAERPLFPGYLLARINRLSDDLLRIRSAPGIAYILPPAGPPALVSEAVVSQLRTRLAAHRDEIGSQKLHRGDRVRIMSGPLRWHDALFDRHMTATGRVRVLLDFVERTVAVDIEESLLRRTG